MASELLTIDRKSGSRGSIIFVHGLDGDAFETWGRTEAGDENFWPDWLAQESSLAELSIYSLAYAAELSDSTLSLDEIGRSVLGNLKSTPEILDGPIAFVCHGLGGLVVKQMLRHAYEERERDADAGKLVENTAQVVFIATPHRGADVATLVERTSKWPLGKRFSRVTVNLSSDGEAVAELHNWYVEFCDPRWQDIAHLVFVEKRKLHGFTMVDQDSASLSALGIERHPVDADHNEICKPTSRNAELYKLTLALLKKLSASRPLPRDAAGYIVRSEPIETEPAEADDSPPRQRLGAFAAAPLRLASGLLSKLAEVRPATWGWLGIGTATVALGGLLVLQVPYLKPFSSDVAPASYKAAGKAPEAAAPSPDRTKAETTLRGAAAKLTDEERRKIWEEEDAKRRAEEARRLEETKLAALKAAEDERARRADEEQRRVAAAEAAPTKQVEVEKSAASRDAEEKLASIESETDPAKLKKIAAESPEAKPAAEARLVVLAKMTSAIQDGLRRAGCFEPASTGNWRGQTRAAAELFNKHAKTTPISVDGPTPAAEEILSRVKGSVCPGCKPPQVKRNGVCVFLECPMGQVRPAGGECEAAYVAWVGYDATEAGASSKFASIREGFPLSMRGKVPDIKVSAQGARFSVRVGPGTTKDDVGDLCRRLKEEGFSDKCLPSPQ